jgi:hypothetical protein
MMGMDLFAMDSSISDVPTLLRDGKYSEVIDLWIHGKNLWTPKDWRQLSGVATAYLCVRNYDEAVITFEEVRSWAIADHSRDFRGVHMDNLGGSLWLSGRQAEGVALWREFVAGLMNRKIHFADLSGGYGVALLLWYGGVSCGDNNSVALAIEYMKKSIKRQSARAMPGPLAKFILQGMTIEEILLEKYGSSDLKLLEVHANTNLRLRRDLCEVLLCLATEARSRKNEDACLALMRRCARLENPLLQIEWFLARGEVERH